VRIAVAVWQSRISPVFDTARQLLMLDIENGCESQRTEQSIFGPSMQKRVDQLVELDVDVLLCGAISRQLADMVAASGIRLVPWLTGEAEGVLQWYLTGKPIEPRFLMPGCDRQRHRVRGMHGRGPATHMRNHREESP
jgi:predicted Fe-Mo cluster-binding NifX family protein